MRFLLDANFLLLAGKYKTDVLAGLEEFGQPDLYTLDLVMREVENLAKAAGSTARYARIGLHLVEKNKVKVIQTSGKNTDEELVALAAKGFVVCTQDRALRKRIKGRGSVVFLRQGRYLVKG